MFTIVAYDIVDDRRRIKIANTLEDFGNRVQYSVFECDLTEKQFDVLRKRLSKHVKEGDSIRYYQICSPCRERIIIVGEGKPTRDDSFYMA